MKMQLTCDYCGSTFERESREIKRSQKKGRKSYCSRRCCGKDNLLNIPPGGSNYPIWKHAGDKKDEYTGFREHLRRARARHHEVFINLDDLLEVWENQKGTCPYSGIKLTKVSSRNNNKITTASLDRIDSSKGYVKGNIQFVAMPINHMKNSLSHDQTIELCKTISKNWSYSLTE